MGIPEAIEEAGFDFHWDPAKVWALDVPVTELPLEDLAWHLDLPFWSAKADYDLAPRIVMVRPNEYPEHWDRVQKADPAFPIDIMAWKGRWVILDGLHRLARLASDGASSVRVRQIPHSAIPLIAPP
ncbi:MAG TPA: hypothetical protein VFN61_07210 [Acidimicrobiales bacterium]|nr:hypothetical protein [Acidimicrobiales bacterium]